MSRASTERELERRGFEQGADGLYYKDNERVEIMRHGEVRKSHNGVGICPKAYYEPDPWDNEL